MTVVSSKFHEAGAWVVARLVVRVVRGSFANGSVARKGMLGAADITIMERMMGASGMISRCCWLLLLMLTNGVCWLECYLKAGKKGKLVSIMKVGAENILCENRLLNVKRQDASPGGAPRVEIGTSTKEQARKRVGNMSSYALVK